ncbi:hypothetical protein WH279_13805 [Erwinia sp. MYb375]|uniref:hypothetical protein n=2 Tax=Erwinia TaxID=551 RepID=UPI0030A21F06
MKSKSMPQSNRLIVLIVGAPGCGKTTLSHFISTILDHAEAHNSDVESIAAMIDDFVYCYGKTHPDGLPQLATHTLNKTGVILPHGVTLGSGKVAETSDLPDYQNELGEVVRALTPRANAFAFSQILSQKANVIISGTGMCMYRFLPLLALQPARKIKVIIPDKQMRGYFPNTLEHALSIRTGTGGMISQRLLTAETLMELYAAQDDFLREGGYWKKVSGLHTFSSLADTIISHSSDIPQKELSSIQQHMNHILTENQHSLHSFSH